MKEIVGQLVALVGGAGSQTAYASQTQPNRHHVRMNLEHQFHAVERPKSKTHGFGKSDEVLHKIARPSSNSRQAVSKSTGKTIPLDKDEEDMKEFNN
jgi:hypothetical protein